MLSSFDVLCCLCWRCYRYLQHATDGLVHIPFSLPSSAVSTVYCVYTVLTLSAMCVSGGRQAVPLPDRYGQARRECRRAAIHPVWQVDSCSQWSPFGHHQVSLWIVLVKCLSVHIVCQVICCCLCQHHFVLDSSITVVVIGVLYIVAVDFYMNYQNELSYICAHHFTPDLYTPSLLWSICQTNVIANVTICF